MLQPRLGIGCTNQRRWGQFLKTNAPAKEQSAKEKAKNTRADSQIIYTKVLSFDEETGDLKEGQDLITVEPTSSNKNEKKDTVVPTPWEDWAVTPLALSMGTKACARCHAFAVIHMLFRDGNVTNQPVQVMYNVQKKRTTVVASKDLQVGELKIAPWVSDLGNLSTDSKHLLDPDRTIIKVTLKNKAEETAPQGKPQERLDVKERCKRVSQSRQFQQIAVKMLCSCVF